MTSFFQMEVLFGSLPEMLDFQRVFLQTLEDRIKSCPNFSDLETPGQFKVSIPESHSCEFTILTFLLSTDLKKLLFSLGGSFLFYADHFKHYSGFCANHIKAQKVLERGDIWSSLGSRERNKSITLFSFQQQRLMEPLRGSWNQRTQPISTHPLWSHTWSNLSRDSWNIHCCSESWCL